MINLVKRSELVLNIKSFFQNVIRKAKFDQQKGRPLGQILIKIEKEFLASLNNTINKLKTIENLIDLEEKKTKIANVISED